MDTVSQKFFVERLLELLHRETIDSYRVRVLNPLLSVKEVLEVYKGLVEGSVKNYETLELCISETLSLLKKDDTVVFQTIQKKFFEDEILRKVKKETFTNLYTDVRNAIITILKENPDYSKRVIALLCEAIDTPLKDDPFPQLDNIYGLTGILATELLRRGYDKGFLYPICYRIFVKNHPEDFSSAFQQFSGLLSSPGTDYHIWFKIYAPRLTSGDWPVFPNWEVKTSLMYLSDSAKQISQGFLAEKRGYFFTGSTFRAQDHFTALQLAKQSLAEVLDLVGLAHHQNRIELHGVALVFPTDRPWLAGMQKVKYIPDGKFPSGEGVLNQLQQKTPAILDNSGIAPETKEKIKSALRYLRYGNESLELEHQLINYWIGLEYLFSNDRDSTFTRIKTIFPVLQALAYIQRNFRDFHATLCQIKATVHLKGFEESNVNCLLARECLESVRDDIFDAHPLISYRAWKILNRLVRDEKNGTKEYIQRHRMHLEWHLARIYRVRNEIVHEAKHSFDNQTLTSNLRYYLAFTLSMIIDHFSQPEPDTRSMEEFFSLQRLRYRSLEYQEFPLEAMLNLDHDFELLS